MKKLLFIAGSTASICIMLYAGYFQRNLGKQSLNTSQARQGLNLVANANGDSTILNEAISVLEQALQLDKDDPLVLFGLGWAHQLLNQNQRAEKYYSLARLQLQELNGYIDHNMKLISESKLPLTSGSTQ